MRRTSERFSSGASLVQSPQHPLEHGLCLQRTTEPLTLLLASPGSKGRCGGAASGSPRWQQPPVFVKRLACSRRRVIGGATLGALRGHRVTGGKGQGPWGRAVLQVGWTGRGDTGWAGTGAIASACYLYVCGDRSGRRGTLQRIPSGGAVIAARSGLQALARTRRGASACVGRGQNWVLGKTHRRVQMWGLLGTVGITPVSGLVCPPLPKQHDHVQNGSKTQNPGSCFSRNGEPPRCHPGGSPSLRIRPRLCASPGRSTLRLSLALCVFTFAAGGKTKSGGAEAFRAGRSSTRP